jgi:hypothetical protein
VLTFFPSRRNWDSPTPLVPGGHARFLEREWGSLISDEGTLCGMYICTYLIFHGLAPSSRTYSTADLPTTSKNVIPNGTLVDDKFCDLFMTHQTTLL